MAGKFAGEFSLAIFPDFDLGQKTLLTLLGGLAFIQILRPANGVKRVTAKATSLTA